MVEIFNFLSFGKNEEKRKRVIEVKQYSTVLDCITFDAMNAKPNKKQLMFPPCINN